MLLEHMLYEVKFMYSTLKFSHQNHKLLNFNTKKITKKEATVTIPAAPDLTEIHLH